MAALTSAWQVEAAAPPGRYNVDSATVYDARTGLTWQRVVDVAVSEHSRASDYCRDLDLAGPGWRLPTRAELLSLVDPTRVNPAIDIEVFPNTPAGPFWSKTKALGVHVEPSEDRYWNVNFARGFAAAGVSEAPNILVHVRCVR
jgi:hypothetical protein